MLFLIVNFGIVLGWASDFFFRLRPVDGDEFRVGSAGRPKAILEDTFVLD